MKMLSLWRKMVGSEVCCLWPDTVEHGFGRADACRSCRPQGCAESWGRAWHSTSVCEMPRDGRSLLYAVLCACFLRTKYFPFLIR